MSELRAGDAQGMVQLRVEAGRSEFTSGVCGEETLVSVLTGAFADKPCDGAIAVFTDEVQGMTYDELRGALASEDRLIHLLELRAFSQDRELHALRDVIGKELSWRLVVDGDGAGGDVDHLDERQYLDIGKTFGTSSIDERAGSFPYRSMSGGAYRLPKRGAQRIWIRNYLDYDGDGLAAVVDFRIVGLLGKGE